MLKRRRSLPANVFIIKLPRTKGEKDSVTNWVDRPMRILHFISDTAVVDVANSCFSDSFKLRGLAENTVSNRDPKLFYRFWNHLVDLFRTMLNMLTSHHPRTHGASEVMNKMTEIYLRCYVSIHQNDWDALLLAAKFAYNSAVTEDLGMSSLETDIGNSPKSPFDIKSGAKIHVESIKMLN